MKKAGICAGLIVIFLVGCGVAHGKKTLTITAGRTVNIHGAALYFGGFPRGPMITLECPGGQHDISELEEGQTTDELCGVKVKLVSYGQSGFNNDNATFEVSW